MSFSHLGLSDKVLAAVAATGYTTPTPIQEQAIPHVLARRDVLGIAQTGTGKTAAFVLPMLTMLEKGRARARMPRTLILEPTRELAAQVKEQFDKYGAGQKLNVALLIGGVSFGDQDTKLTRGVDVLIATPGRLLDHTERGGLLLTGVELLVIDEADRMLDMGFIPDIERICKMIYAADAVLHRDDAPRNPPHHRNLPAQSREDRSFKAGNHGGGRGPVPGQCWPRAAREARDAAPPVARG
jgi:superfamily II DNA/RNA helicase